jgi:tetratricopeptide (TPR) repeat protein
VKIFPRDLVPDDLGLAPSARSRMLLAHLRSCARCRARVGDLLAAASPPARAPRPPEAPDQTRRPLGELRSTRRDIPAPSPPGAAASPLRDLDVLCCVLAEERAAAPLLLAELMGHPGGGRELLLRNTDRFRTWGLLELLLERSREHAASDPSGAEEQARLGVRLGEQLDADFYDARSLADIRARAWSNLGNALRVRSDLQGAELAFRTAHEQLLLGTRDALERALFLDLKASLRRSQRRFAEALRLLGRAMSIYLDYGETHRAGRVLVKMDCVHQELGDVAAGIPLLYRALELIDPRQEPRLLLCVHHNLTNDLVDAGRVMEAQRVYSRSRALYRNFSDPWTQSRRRWVKGKIAGGLGQSGAAEALLTSARQGFLAAGFPDEAGLVALELAALYAQQGRLGELKELAAETARFFASLGIQREAFAALAFLRQAADAERATRELVSAVATFLRRCRLDPDLRFRA